MIGLPSLRMVHRELRAGLLVALGAWLAAVLVIAIMRDSSGTPTVAGLASTPRLIARGDLWTLLSSSLPVSRFPFLEIAGMVGAMYGVWRVAGITAVWAAGLAAHVGATLVAYAGIGGIWLADHGAVDELLNRNDYGISAIWLGELGFLTAALWGRNRRLAYGVGALSLGVSVGLLPVAGPMATIEHLLALIIGGALPMTFPGLLRLP